MPSSASVIRLTRPLRRASFNASEIQQAAYEEQMEAARQEAYQKGFADATAFYEQQLAEQRADVIQLMEQTFKSIEDQRSELVRQIAAVLPGVATEIARRVLSGIDPSAERVQRMVDEVLTELAPGTRDIQVFISPADFAVLGKYQEKFSEKYPGLVFSQDSELAVGDCRLKSGFGIVDARVATKLENIAKSLQ